VTNGAKFNLSLHIEVAEISAKGIEGNGTSDYLESFLASDTHFLTVLDVVDNLDQYLHDEDEKPSYSNLTT
jgi:hypothetical protein